MTTGFMDTSLVKNWLNQKFQFERFGYFVAERVTHVPRSKPVFNRVTGFKDSWGK